MNKVNIKFAAVDKTKDYKIPTKRVEDAGYDIYPSFKDDEFKIKAHQTRLIPTNIASALPYNYYFQVEERGSTGSKGIKKSAGVVDSGYRGEIFIAITNCNDVDLYITKEDISNYEFLDNRICYPYSKAIAQLVLHEVPQLESEEISYEELMNIPSERGMGSRGSSGK